MVFHHIDILRSKQKKIEKAEWYKQDISVILKRSPENPENNYIAAHYYRLRGEFKKAIGYYKKALKLKPEYPKARLSLGLSYVASGEENKGMKDIKACRNNKDILPGEAEAYLNTAYKIIAARALKKEVEIGH